MALGTLLGAAATAAATSAASSAASGLFGGGDDSPSGGLNANTLAALQRLANFRPVSFTGGGLSSTFDKSGNRLSVTSDQGRRDLISGLASTFGNQAQALGGLRARVAPGASDLRAARLQEIENARRRSIGNLRENLARRRVLGSSFGQDAEARAELEFAQAAEKTAAEVTLQELELTNQLLNQQFEAARGQFQTNLGELNLQADLAAKLSQDATAALSGLAQTQSRLAVQSAMQSANLLAEEQAAAGEFFGQTFEPVFDSLGSGIESIFSGFGSGGGSGGIPLPDRNPLRV